MLLKPFDVSLLRVFGNITQQLHSLRFVAGFARVILRDDSFNLDCYHETGRPN